MKTPALEKKEIKTPLGPMLAIVSDKGLCALEFIKPGRQKALSKRIERWFRNTPVVEGNSSTLLQTEEWLTNYFRHKFESLKAIPLDLRGSEFELSVWKEMRKIKTGKTKSYGEIAKTIGKPKASRAVGLVSGRNPISLIVPCHRIIGKTGKLTGYGGGLDKKEWLLKHEH